MFEHLLSPDILPKLPPQESPNYSDLNGLLPLLTCLDQRLEQAIATIQAQGEPDATTMPYRGLLQLADDELAQQLAQNPGAPRFGVESSPEVRTVDVTLRDDAPIAWLQQAFSLSLFELEALIIALAPELDRRYEQMYAYLQDDIRCKRPTVDLVLNLLCVSPAEKLEQRQKFSTESLLIHHRLLHLYTPHHQTRPTLLGQELHIDTQVMQLLLGQQELDHRLVSCCKWAKPSEIDGEWPGDEKVFQGLIQLVHQYWQTEIPLRLYFQGEDGQLKRQVVETLAAVVGIPLLIGNLRQVLAGKEQAEELLRLMFRAAWLTGSWLYLEDLDKLLEPDAAQLYQTLLSQLATQPEITFLSGKKPWVPVESPPLGIISILFPSPDFDQRQYYWHRYLEMANANIDLSDQELQSLVDRFRFTESQIANVVDMAGRTAQWHAMKTETDYTVTGHDLFQAARAQSGHDLSALAQKLNVRYSWQDLVLPSDLTARLQELCQEAKHHHQIWDTWGFGGKLSQGKGLTALFSGLPGTGKTMAAEVVAHELELDLYKIDLSQMVSKYIGETEKNLNRVFTAAASSNAILLFDEADALFGKRSEVKDAHDRYANIETSYLLQKMEEYDGVAILTTNLRSNMDEAFVRRLRFIVEFPLPSVVERQQIWEQVWPEQLPRSEIDVVALAEGHELVGANIRNVALRAAFLAASDGGVVTMGHVKGALRREYQKMGKLLMMAELDGELKTRP